METRISMSLLALVVSVCACSSGSAPSTTTTAEAGVEPARADAGARVDASGAQTSGGQLGSQCTAYFGEGGCCEELAQGIAQAEEACASSRKALEKQLAGGSTAASLEATCKRSLDEAKKLGKCK